MAEQMIGLKLPTVSFGATSLEVSTVRRNEIEIEWPARSGRAIRVPEIDRPAWLTLPFARQREFLPASNRFSIASNRRVMVHCL